jgi:hypothetical protein
MSFLFQAPLAVSSVSPTPVQTCYHLFPLFEVRMRRFNNHAQSGTDLAMAADQGCDDVNKTATPCQGSLLTRW